MNRYLGRVLPKSSFISPRRLICVAVALGACAVPRPSAAPTLSIALARQQPVGAAVQVDGVVTMGITGGGFALQDRTGGIFVAVEPSPRFAEGTRVRAAGRLTDEHGLLTLAADEVRALGRTYPVDAKPLHTSQVGEAYEGSLVEVRGRVMEPVVNDMPYGYKITVDDGSGPLLVFVPPPLTLDPRCVLPGHDLAAVGMSGQYDSHYEVVASILRIDGREWAPGTRCD